MANAVIGALRVNLGLDSAQFTRGLQNAQKGLGQFGAIAARSFAAVAAGATLAAGALGVAVKGAIDHADALAKSAQKAGVTVEALSRLEFAAKLSDVSLESLTGGLQKLSKTMADAVVTPTSNAATAFKALGIELKNNDGTLRKSDQVLADVADRFSRMEDGSTKTALSMILLGRSGAELIPLLNSGADGLKRYADESDRLGATISGKTAKAAEEFNDTLTRIQAIMEGVVNKVMEAALPALQSLADMLASPEFAQAAQDLAKWIVEAMNAVIGAVTLAVNKISQFSGEIAKVARLAADIASGNFAGAVNNWQIATAQAEIDQRRKALFAPGGWAGGAFKAPAEITVNGGKTDPLTPTFQSGSAASDAAKAMSDQLKAMNADLASQKEAWEELQQPIRDTVDAISSGLSGAMSGLVSDLIKGKDAVGGLINAFGNLGDKLIQMAMDQLIQGLIGSLVGAAVGGGFNSIGMGHSAGLGRGLTGAAVYGTGGGFYGIPSYDGGGFTGYGGGPGLDGKGGFMAMLHPNETVLDHTKGQGGPMISISITGSRQDAAEIARLVEPVIDRKLRQYQRNPDR